MGDDADLHGYVGQNTVDPAGLVFLLIMGVLTLILPRKYAVLPMIMVACLISSAQRIIILSGNFHFLRIMLIFASVRILARGEYTGLRIGKIDRIVIAFAITKAIVYTIQWGTLQAFIFQAGASYDAMGMYYFFRCLVRTFEDLNGLGFGFIVVSIPVFIAFSIENTTGRNLFAFLGGVPPITAVRDGKIRCQGAFATCIIAGVFWSSMIPLIAARWFDPRQNKLVTLTGIGCFVANTLFTNSSTPLMGLAIALIGASFFRFRKRMKTVRWMLLGLMIFLHFYQDGGIYYVLARVNLFASSTGWHRAYLMDRCVHYFFEWWIFGTQDTGHWAEGTLGGVGLKDVTNQYVLEGVRGGFITMCLFIALIVMTFKNVGRMLKMSEVTRDRAKLTVVWALGVVMLVHVITFLSVTYFGSAFVLIWLSVGVTQSLHDTVLEQDRRMKIRMNALNTANLVYQS
jgi:hypothetical protein